MELRAEIAALKQVQPLSNDSLTIENLKLGRQVAELGFQLERESQLFKDKLAKLQKDALDQSA
jgi:hypothetical protein